MRGRRRERGRGGRRALLTLGFASALVFFVQPAPARGHLVTTGLGPFYDGLSHLALSLEDLVPALALALLAGLGGAGHGRAALLTLPAAWLAGGLVGLASGFGVAPGVTTLSFLVLGGLVAADARLPRPALLALAGTLGLVHGLANGGAMAAAKLGALGLVGIVTALFALVALTGACVVSLRAPWTRIAVRVAGSWIAAIGLLMLGWSLRPGP